MRDLLLVKGLQVRKRLRRQSSAHSQIWVTKNGNEETGIRVNTWMHTHEAIVFLFQTFIEHLLHKMYG